MSVVQTLIGNVKGPKGDTGAAGETGATGSAATITVGTTTTTAYGNAAQVTNSGTSGAAVLDFVIPQGRPGEATTTMGDLTLDSITSSTADFPSPQVGDTGKVVFGKIVKFFADTVAALAAKLDIANIANNLTTTSSGYALDARQGKALNDALTATSTSTLTKAINSGTVDSNKCVKKADIVSLSFRQYGIDVIANGIVATLPTGYRPTYEQYIMGFVRASGSSSSVPVIATVTTAGEVKVGYSTTINMTQVGVAGSIIL